jgi:parallel beta-helix repeat protein
MTYTFKLSRRLAMSRYSGMIALLALAAACSDNEPLNAPTADTYSLDRPLQVEVWPKAVTAEVNQPIQLAARGRLASGDTVSLAVDWTASGGTISADGVFSATSPGNYKLEGRRRGGKKGDTTTVVVIDSVPNLQELILSPDTATVQPAQSRQFVAQGKLSDGSTTAVGAVWKASGGSIDAGGNYVAGNTSGHYHVIATSVSGSLADTAAVFVPEAAPTLTTLVLTPAATTLATGGTQQFAVQGRLSDGSMTTVQAQYSAAGGTITSAGLFTAGPAAGSYRVIATSAEGPADTSDVTVRSAIASTGPVIYPGSDIQAAVNANPAGTSFLLKAGVHRMQQVRPKDGDSFVGESGTILSGARLLTTFTRSGGYWVASGQTQQGVRQGQCEASHPLCDQSEELFVDDVRLEPVASLSALAVGKWYFDYAGDRIYLADDPSGRRVEASVKPHAFEGTASNVALRGLIIEKYATPAQEGAIHGRDSDGWIVEGNEVRWNHGVGIRIGDRMHVLNNHMHHNGQFGISGFGDDVLVEGNEWDRNNTAGFNSGWGAGGSKFSKTRRLIVRANRAHDNAGTGIWTDIDNIYYTCEKNIVTNNADQGIFHEISYDAVLRDNIVEGNGFQNSSWLWGAGILVAASPNVEVVGNQVRNNANGITAIQQDRSTSPGGAYGPHEISNLYVHDNVITMTDGKTGLAQSVGDNSYFSGRNNRWVHNTYRLGANAKYFAWVGATLSEVEWRGYGEDVDGIFQR